MHERTGRAAICCPGVRTPVSCGGAAGVAHVPTCAGEAPTESYGHAAVLQSYLEIERYGLNKRL